MKKILLTLIILNTLFGAKYAGEFLRINPDTQSAGMGGVGVFGSKNQSSFILNPANLSQISKISISSLYASLYGDVRDPLAYYHHIGVALPIPMEGLVFAINWLRLGVDNIPYFPSYSDYERYAQIEKNEGQVGDGDKKYFSDREDAVFITLARKFNYNINFGWDYFVLPLEINSGLNLKFINIELAGNQAGGIGFDAGFNFMIDYNKLTGLRNNQPLQLGFCVTDFNKTGISWSSTAQDAIPIRFKFGVMLPLEYTKWHLQFRPAYDLIVEEGERYHKNGLEVIYRDFCALRVGLDDDQLSAGTGIRFKNFSLDYAYQNSLIGAVNRVGLAYEF